MIINPYDRERLLRKFPRAEFRPIDKTKGFEVGKTYFCGYWHEAFEVLEIERNVPIWDTVYFVKWEDGHTNAHSTEPDYRRDFEIIFEEA